MHIRRPLPDTKVRALCEDLYKLAQERGPGAQLPTTRQLCDMFLTSRATLNEALNELESQNVLYRKQRSGIFVSDKLHRKSIAILLNAASFLRPENSPFWGTLWGLLTQEAQNRTTEFNHYYSIFLVLPTQERAISLPEEVMRMIEARTLHGVLSIGLDAPTATWLVEQHIPFVAFAGHGTRMVASSTREMIRLAVSALAAQGCQHIGFWLEKRESWVDSSQPSTEDEEIEDFRHSLQEQNLEFDARLVHLHRNRDQTLQKLGYNTALDVFAHSTGLRPDGLFIADDMMTHGALIAFQELGLRVGQDIRLATHANAGSPILFGQTGHLTLLEFEPADFVRAMFATLDLMLNHEMPSELVTWIRPKLRQS